MSFASYALRVSSASALAATIVSLTILTGSRTIGADVLPATHPQASPKAADSLPSSAATNLPPPPLALTHDIEKSLDFGLRALAGTSSHHSPALAVAILQNGNIVNNRGFGEATAAMRFRIGSITKMFAAVSIMQLVEQHRIDLDATVATYLREAPYADAITVRQLLAHTSGLWNYGDDAFNSGAVSKETTPLQILALASKHPLSFKPGARFAYSNTGYVVLGLIVERVAKQRLAEYERQHIFEPADMRDTTVGAPAKAPMATGYMSASGPVAPAFDASWLYADGDIVSTAADLVRFDSALLVGSLISQQSFAAMQATPVQIAGGVSQGLGLMIQSRQGMQLVGHHGGVPGFESSNTMVPAQGLAIVVLSDAFDFDTSRADGIVFATLLPGLAEAPRPLPASEDPSVTARFRSALEDLLRGDPDRAQYTAEAAAALTDTVVALADDQLKPLGKIVNVGFYSREESSSATIYTYDVTFVNGSTLTWHFVVAPTGKIAGIYD